MMVSRDTLIEHLRYTKWASERVLAAAEDLLVDELTHDLGASFGSILGTLIHTFCGDRMWLSRVEGHGRQTMFDPGEELTLGILCEEWPALLDRWVEEAARHEPTETIRYLTTAGKEFETPFWQVTLHVVNHGTYHRGQASVLFRKLGRVPPNLDLINYYRDKAA